jgi:hypothetical protein
MTGLSAREQRLIALLILLLLVAGIWQLLLAPVISGFTARSAERAQLAATIERNERLIASVPQLRRRIERQRPDRERFALAAPSRDAAADLLRQRLQRSFEATGASPSALGDSDAADRWVGASVEGPVTLDQLVRLLTDLQNQPPYLVVTGLTVVADRAFQSGKLDVMDVKIDVAIPYSSAA